MPAPDLGFALGLPPERAVRYFQSLGYATPANWREAQIAAEQQAFFITGLYREDVVEELRASLQEAINQGKSQREWREDVGGRMAQHGWLLDDGLMVDSKTGEQLAVRFGEHRLNSIYRTNVKNAFAAGRWQEITRVQKAMPYLEYTAVMDDRTRDEHAALDGHIYPIDDPFWQTFYPPNGFNCRCNVIQHSARDLEAMGRVAESSEGQWEDVEQLVGRDGDTVTTRGLKMPNGQVISADIGFDRNVGANYLDRLQQIAAEKHGTAFAERLAMQSRFASSDSIIHEGEQLYTRYKEVMDEYIAKKEPHLGILEIMRREGVATGGEVAAYSSDARTAAELVESLQRYPKAWVDASNKMGRVLVEDGIHRAWHLTPDDAAAFIAAMRKKNLPLWDDKEYEQFRWACKGRNPAFQQGDGLIKNNLSFGSKRRIISTHVHEFAHRLQQVMPELDSYFSRLWRERTAGEAVQSMNAMTGNRQYEDHERGKRDDFPDPYYGRMYGDEDDPQPREMMSMIFEALLGSDPGKFAGLVAKPDFLHFGLALLVRYTP